MAAILLFGALAAWAHDSTSSPAPGPEVTSAESARGRPDVTSLRAHPRVTVGERSGEGDAVPAPTRADMAADAGEVSASSGSGGSDRPLPIEVFVVDTMGDPVAGAEVEVPRYRTQTDGVGRALLPRWGYDLGMPSQDRYWKTVRVRAPGFIPVAHVGGRAREWIRLESGGGRVSGRCADAEDRPMGGVTVALVWRQAPTTLETLAQTESDGRFTIEDAPWGRAQLEIRDSAWTATPREVVAPEEDVHLVLSPRDDAMRGVRSGHDFDASRAPTDLDPPPPPSPTTDPPWIDVDARDLGGREIFASAVMEAGALQPLGWIPPRSVGRLQLPGESVVGLLLRQEPAEAWRQTATARTLVRLRRTPSASLRLRLVDPRGRPIEDGVVYVRWADLPSVSSGWSSSSYEGPLAPDAQGEGRRVPGEHLVSSVPPGTYDLVWRNSTYDRPVLLRDGVVMPDPATPLDAGDVVLPPPAVVEVAVIDAAGPVPGAILRWISAADEVVVRADRDGLGRLRIRDPSHAWIEASHPERGTGRRVLGPDARAGRAVVLLEREAPRAREEAR